MKKIYPIMIGLLFLLVILPHAVLAQEATTTTENPINQLKPVITSEDFIEFGKKALFDAAESGLIDENTIPSYRWEFSDSNVRQFGKETIHDFERPGIHKVTLTIQQGTFTATADKELFVFNRRIAMITDLQTQADLKNITDQAASNGIYLDVIASNEEETGFLTEEKLVPMIAAASEFIKSADGIIFYTKGSLGLQAFTRYWQNLEPDKKIDVYKKLLIKITDDNIAIDAKLTQQSFQVMKPKFILLTRKEALNPIFETENFNELSATLQSRAIEHRLIDASSEKSNLFFLSHAITNFITKGIPTNTIYLLLALPFIALVITFARQVIGIQTFGIYTPLVISLSLFILGIFFGVGTLILIIIVSSLLRLLLNKFKLLYIPKTGLILSSLGLSFLALIWFLAYYRISLAITLAVFPMLVMSTISEKFLSAQSEEGLRGALFGVFNTIVVSVAAYYLVIWTAFNNLIMSWPELVILPLLGMVLLGKFTGLRLNEYFRFRSLFKEKDIEE